MVAPLTFTTSADCNVVVTCSFEAESQLTGGSPSGAAWDNPSLGAYRLRWLDTVSLATGQSPELTMAGPRARYAIEWQFPASAGRTLTVELITTCGLGYRLVRWNIELQVEEIKR